MTTRHRLLRRRSAAGLTLIELMVAMVIGLVIVLASVAALTVARRGFTTVDAASQLRDNGRFAADLIQRVGAQAGYRDVFIVTRPPPKNTTREPNVMGFNNSLLNSSTPTSAPIDRTLGTVGYGSDILILRYQAAELYTDAGAVAAATVSSDQTMIDCAGNTPATVPNYKTDEQAYTNRIVSIFHVAINNGEPALMCTYSLNGAAPWTTVPLVQGVEDFQVLYGVDGVVPYAPLPATASSAPDFPSRYLRADEMAVPGDDNGTRINWGRVRSIRIGLVLRTPPGVTQDRDTQTFFPLGGIRGSSGNASAALATTEARDPGTVFIPTPDGRLRQSVTFSIHLRNDQTL